MSATNPSTPAPTPLEARDSALADLRLEYRAEDILDDGDYEAPLVAGEVRCHGGFDATGAYRSPRTIHRRPAIEAWQTRLAREGAELVDISRDLMPPQYPNALQSVWLIQNGVREPMVRALTIISIVEGFGAIIRDVAVPDLEALVVEPLAGTALSHLKAGLFEAHARDEAGHRDQGGHKQMWEAARDLAFENPKVPGDVLMRLMGRRQQRRKAKRPLPELDESLERMLATMAQVLVVEVFAEGTFEWGKTVLSDARISAKPEDASRMVGYIQADENPHVEYLRTALSEIRARTLRTVDGRTIAGRDAVDKLLHRVLSNMTRTRLEEQREEARRGLTEAAETCERPDAVIERFDELESTWTPPERTGFEPVAPAP